MENLNDHDIDQLCKAAALFLQYFNPENTNNSFSPVEVAEILRGMNEITSARIRVPADDYFKLAFRYVNKSIKALSASDLEFFSEQNSFHRIGDKNSSLYFGNYLQQV